MAPINVREESEKNTMGNQVAAMFVPLGSHIASVQERMKYVTEETIKSKSMTESLGARQMSEMAKLAPAPVMMAGATIASRLKLADHVKPTLNTVVTNVPGPPVPIYSAGAKMVNVFGLLCLVDGVKLGHVVQSYVDKVTLTFTACRTAIPDPDFYAQCIQESFEEHHAAIKARLGAVKTGEAKSPKTEKTKAAKAPAKKTAKTTVKKPVKTQRTSPQIATKTAPKTTSKTAKTNGAAKTS
jgi:hypothetical protein